MLSPKDLTLRDRFCSFNGMEVISVEKGHAKVRMEIGPHHLNGIGTVHGGAIFTLADLAFAAASNCADEIVASINANMSFTQAVSEGVLLAEAREVTRSNKLVTYEARVTDTHGSIIATFQGIGYIKRKP